MAARVVKPGSKTVQIATDITQQSLSVSALSFDKDVVSKPGEASQFVQLPRSALTARKQIKVLQIIDSLGMGGAETWLMEVLRQWSGDSRQIARMDFLLTSGQPGLFDNEARRLGANLFYVPFQKKHLFAFARELRRILRDGAYDAVHDHADYISGWHFLLGLGRMPAIRVTHVHNPSYQIHTNYGLTLSRRLSTRLGRRLVSKCATVALGTSRQALDEYGFFASPLLRLPKRVLHCGFQLSRFNGDPKSVSAALCKEFGWPPETPVILFAGRLDESLEFDHPRNHKNSGIRGLDLPRMPEARAWFKDDLSWGE